MLKSNYHTHSIFCNHATETLESNVKLAIEKGFENFGISEHGPMEGIDGHMRLNEHKMKKYFSEMNRLKEKYKDQINLYTGYEADIVSHITGESNVEWIIKHFDEYDLNYILLANHTYGNKGHAFTTLPAMEMAKEWLENTKKAWSTNKFLYMVHPDSFANAYLEANKEWDEVAHFLAEEVTKFAAQTNMALGININGLKEGKGYPSLEFFKIAAKNGASAIIELDAHDREAFETKWVDKARELVAKSRVKLLDKLDIIKK